MVDAPRIHDGGVGNWNITFFSLADVRGKQRQVADGVVKAENEVLTHFHIPDFQDTALNTPRLLRFPHIRRSSRS